MDFLMSCKVYEVEPCKIPELSEYLLHRDIGRGTSTIARLHIKPKLPRGGVLVLGSQALDLALSNHYLEKVCCSMLVDGSPGSLKPFTQSTVVVAAVVVVLGDQIKSLLVVCKST